MVSDCLLLFYTRIAMFTELFMCLYHKNILHQVSMLPVYEIQLNVFLGVVYCCFTSSTSFISYYDDICVLIEKHTYMYTKFSS